MNIPKFLTTTSFIDQPWWLAVNFFTESQKETTILINGSVTKGLICQYDAQNVQHSQKQHFSCGFPCGHNMSKFLVWLYAKYIAFTCVNLLLFLLPFIVFIVLLPFSMNFKFNLGLNFITIRLFHLNCKITLGFFPIKEKSLGLYRTGL